MKRVFPNATPLVLTLVLLALLSLGAQPALAQRPDATQPGPYFTVNTTDDVDDGACTSSHCSLREAIEAANAHANSHGPDYIYFDLPEGAVIHLTSSLPTITDPVVIDGTTVLSDLDPSTPPVGMVELDGSHAGHVNGLVLDTDDSTLRGLIIVHFGRNGVVSKGDRNVVESCYIGTHGTDDAGNGAAGIFVNGGDANRIGGEETLTGNLISGNKGLGILIVNATGGFIQGNFIGTDALGTRALPNGLGIKVQDSREVDIGGAASGDRNLISGNTGAGILVLRGSNNSIEGNVIGLDAGGTKALGNDEGVLLRNTGYNEVGIYRYPGPSIGNIIAGNRSHGIHLIDSPENAIYANTIGTSVAGVQVGNGGHGVLVEGTSENVVIDENHIAYNGGAGVHVNGTIHVGIMQNAIYENHIGITEAHRGDTHVNPPHITQVTMNTVRGTAPPGAIGVDIYGDDGNQGRYYLGSADVDASGHFEFTGELRGTYITAITNKAAIGRTPAAPNSRISLSWYNSSTFSAPVRRVSPCADPNETNDDWLDATPITPSLTTSTTITGTLCESWDIDFFKLPVASLGQGSTVHVHLDTPGIDLDLALFRPTYVPHDLPLRDLPATTSPSNDVPVKSLPLQNIPLQNIPLQNIPLQNIPLQNIPLQNIPLQNIPLQNIPLQNIPLQNIPLQNIPLQNISLQNIPMVDYSVNPTGEDEDVSDRVVYSSGDYYVMVVGHNGVHSSRPYTLTITVTPPRSSACTFHPPHQGTPAELYWPDGVPPEGIETLIVVPKQRLASIYGEDMVAPMMDALHRLADAPTVKGLVLPVEESSCARQAYKAWDAHFCDVERANAVTGCIKGLIYEYLQQLPNVRSLILVGDDRALPFRRLPDLTQTSNERDYASQSFLKKNTALRAALEQGYILSDDFYADFYPSMYRGWPLYVPDYATGRLVETPEEITAQVEDFLDHGGHLNAHSAALFGYDFLQDSTQRMVETVAGQGLSRTVHNDDSWDADALRQALLAAHHDVNILDAHFTHFLLAPAAYALHHQGDLVRAGEIISATADLRGTVNVSVGCHSGLNVCDDCITNRGKSLAADTDFAQAFARRKAIWIGNSGFGYGDDAAVALSEELATTFVRYLGSRRDMAVGEALRRAKQDYALYNMGAYGPYDRKVVNEATLYGIPNYRVTVPHPLPVGNQDSVWVYAQGGTSSSWYRRFVLTPHLARVTTEEGSYFQAEDGIQALLYNPIQPRSQFDATLDQREHPGLVAHGVMILDGTYQDVPNFDPVITMPVTRTHRYEPQLMFATWQPPFMVRLNHFRHGDEQQEWVTVTPGQFRATRVDTSDPTHVRVIGTERIFQRLRLAVYYNRNNDFTPPTIKRVQARREGNQVTFRVEMPPGTRAFVYATCATNGQLSSLELDREGTSNVWSGVWNNAGRDMSCFIQVRDFNGNVAVTNVKGTLNLPVMPHHWYMPRVAEAQ